MLDDEGQSALEVEFFTRCIQLAVGTDRRGWVRGDILTYDCRDEHVDRLVDEHLNRLFACACPMGLEVLVDDKPVMRVGCDWGQAVALLSAGSADILGA